MDRAAVLRIIQGHETLWQGCLSRTLIGLINLTGYITKCINSVLHPVSYGTGGLIRLDEALVLGTPELLSRFDTYLKEDPRSEQPLPVDKDRKFVRVVHDGSIAKHDGTDSTHTLAEDFRVRDSKFSETVGSGTSPTLVIDHDLHGWGLNEGDVPLRRGWMEHTALHSLISGSRLHNHATNAASAIYFFVWSEIVEPLLVDEADIQNMENNQTDGPIGLITDKASRRK